MSTQQQLTPLSQVLLAAGLVAASLPGWAQDAAPAERKTAVIQEVIVTAQKTAQPASKTPVALSVVSADDLKDAGITDARGLAEVTPNVQMAQESGKLQIAIRGVVSLDMTEKGDPSAAFNVDGAYVARPEAQMGAFLDLDRVEVLRGPQGTLYGRNATSGAINLITAKPGKLFGARIEGEVGSYGARRVEGMINVPINDVLSLRAAASKSERDTYLRAGPNPDIPLDSKDAHAGRDFASGRNAVAEALGNTHHCCYLALNIGVTSNEPLFVHDFYQCIQFQISAEDHRRCAFLFIVGFNSFHIGFIILSTLEGIHQHLLNTHTCIRETVVAG